MQVANLDGDAPGKLVAGETKVLQIIQIAKRVGMFPVSWLESRSRFCSADRFPSCVGIVPVS